MYNIWFGHSGTDFSLRLTRMERIRNECIRGTAQIDGFGNKVREAWMRLFGPVERRDSGYIVQRILNI